MAGFRPHKIKRLGIIGQTGQLARALIDLCDVHGIEAIALGRADLDLSWDPHLIEEALSAYDNIDALINAAAYTAVDAAEEDIDTARRVNSVAPEIFAKFCQKKNIPFIHVSTDYVFNGQNNTPYKVDHPTAPLGVYGETKLLGEDAVEKVGGVYAILRTSWVYDARGKNFMTTMLRLAETRESLNVVRDQKGRPTYAPDLAQASLIAANSLCSDPVNARGVYHVSNSGPIISWADFARAIFEKAKPHIGKNMAVNDIPSSEYPTPAKRPAYSALDLTSFESTFQTSLPDWPSSLDKAISEWVQNAR